MPKLETEYPIFKGIKISKELEEQWDYNTPSEIRSFLEGKYHKLLRLLYNLMNEKMKFIEKPSKNDITTLKEIEEIINV